MKPPECQWESEVLAAVLESRWPERAETELREHAAACPVCAEVAAVAAVLATDREDLRSLAALPDAGRVWWRAQWRARCEAAAVAGRPITAAQVLALACAAGLTGACFGATSEWFQAALREFSVPPLLAEHAVLALAIAAFLVLLPAAVLAAIWRD
ncbi:MAG TPA: hypothetical protein VKX45_09570 [Bryobacteraceae bacterium]|nr:hypothetical protein [Bryobacteraceae bacterium]